MEFIEINLYNGNSPVEWMPNFTHNELHPNADNDLTNQSGFPDVFYIPLKLGVSIQHIRDFYNVPVRVTSTARTQVFNSSLTGSASSSKHILKFVGGKFICNAVDWDFNNSESESNLLGSYIKDVLAKGTLYNTLRQNGITGFGLYNSFMHVDTRDTDFTFQDDYGPFTYWNNSDGIGLTSIIASFKDKEDGSLDLRSILKKNLVVIILFFLVVLMFLFVRK